MSGNKTFVNNNICQLYSTKRVRLKQPNPRPHRSKLHSVRLLKSSQNLVKYDSIPLCPQHPSNPPHCVVGAGYLRGDAKRRYQAQKRVDMGCKVSNNRIKFVLFVFSMTFTARGVRLRRTRRFHTTCSWACGRNNRKESNGDEKWYASSFVSMAYNDREVQRSWL